MPTLARRRRLDTPVIAATNAPAQDALRISPVLKALGPNASPEPAVLVRLLLLAVDDVSGERRLVSSFLRKISMPAALARSGMKIALEVNGETRQFEAADVIWDETRQVCIVEVVWAVTDDAANKGETVKAAGPCAVDAKRAARTQRSVGGTSDSAPRAARHAVGAVKAPGLRRAARANA
jgi:hypothetical protein